VLCGAAWVGKTLTAEVYSESSTSALSVILAARLNVAAMEAILKDTLTRAQRWGASCSSTSGCLHQTS